MSWTFATADFLVSDLRFSEAVQLASHSAGLKPKTVVEEVVTELTGEIDLSAGRQEILLIHRNVVDGKLEKVAVGP